MIQSRKSKAKLLILLASIWIVISLPLPWLISDPDIPQTQMRIIFGIVGVMSIPFIVLGIVWTLKPELANSSN